MTTIGENKLTEMPAKIQKGVYAELPKLLEFVKAGAIEKEMGVNSGWISMRLNRTQNGKYSVRKFNAADMAKLNSGIWKLAEKLMVVNVPYSPDRATCSAYVKIALKDVFVKSLAAKKLGWNRNELSHRMSIGASAKYRPQFTESDLETLTIGVRELAVWMMSYEYFLDQD